LQFFAEPIYSNKKKTKVLEDIIIDNSYMKIVFFGVCVKGFAKKCNAVEKFSAGPKHCFSCIADNY